MANCASGVREQRQQVRTATFSDSGASDTLTNGPRDRLDVVWQAYLRGEVLIVEVQQAIVFIYGVPIANLHDKTLGPLLEQSDAYPFGSEERESELRALDAGADAFVRKQEDLQVILARLSAVLRNAHVEPDAARSLLDPKRILAVDDSPTYLDALSSALRSEEYDVILARSGEQAFELLAAQSVDCVLLDLLMPGMGGRQTCRLARASRAAHRAAHRGACAMPRRSRWTPIALPASARRAPSQHRVGADWLVRD